MSLLDRIRRASIAGLLLACKAAPAADTTEPPPPSASAAPSASAPAAPAAAQPLLDAASFARETEVALVQVDSALPEPPADLPLVTIARKGVFVGRDPAGTYLSLPPDLAKDKPPMPPMVDVGTLDQAVRSARAAYPDATHVRLLVDRSTLYSNMLKAVFAVGAFQTLDFLVSSSSGLRTVALRSAGQPGSDSAPVISMVVRADGIGLSVGTADVGAGCVLGKALPAVPSIKGKADLGGLAGCVGKLKKLSPDYTLAHSAKVNATAEMDAQTVLSAIAVLEAVFPEVHLRVLD